jgi:hypothetical protein
MRYKKGTAMEHDVKDAVKVEVEDEDSKAIHVFYVLGALVYSVEDPSNSTAPWKPPVWISAEAMRTLPSETVKGSMYIHVSFFRDRYCISSITRVPANKEPLTLMEDCIDHLERSLSDFVNAETPYENYVWQWFFDNEREAAYLPAPLLQKVYEQMALYAI